jgi:hypothetical protein
MFDRFFADVRASFYLEQMNRVFEAFFNNDQIIEMQIKADQVEVVIAIDSNFEVPDKCTVGCVVQAHDQFDLAA